MATSAAKFRKLIEFIDLRQREFQAVKAPWIEHEEKVAGVRLRLEKAWNQLDGNSSTEDWQSAQQDIVECCRELKNMDSRYKDSLERAETRYKKRRDAILKAICTEFIRLFGASFVRECLPLDAVEPQVPPDPAHKHSISKRSFGINAGSSKTRCPDPKGSSPWKRRAAESVPRPQPSKRKKSAAQHARRLGEGAQTPLEQPSPVGDEIAVHRAAICERYNPRLENAPTLRMTPGKPNTARDPEPCSAAMLHQDSVLKLNIKLQCGDETAPTRPSSAMNNSITIGGQFNGSTTITRGQRRSLYRRGESPVAMPDDTQMLKQVQPLAIVEQGTPPLRLPSIREVFREGLSCSSSETSSLKPEDDDQLKWRANMTACLINNATRGCTPFYVPLDDVRNRILKSRLEYYDSKELEIIRNIQQGHQVGKRDWSLYESHMQQRLQSLRKEIELDRELDRSSQDILFKSIREIESLVEEISASCVNASGLNSM